MRSFRSLLFLIALASLAVGALMPSPCSNRKAGEREQTSRVGVGRVLLTAPLFVVESRNAFSRRGVRVELVTFDTGKLAFEAMLRGEVDIATAAATPFVITSFVRDDVAIFATVAFSDSDPKIIARKDRAIDSVLDLRGKTLGTTFKTSAHYFTDSLLTFSGLNSTDLQLVDAQPTDLIDGLVSGKIDAAAMLEPNVSIAARSLGLNRMVLEAPRVYREGFHLAVFKSVAEEKRKALVNVIFALSDTQDYNAAHADAAAEVIAPVLKITEDDARRILPSIQFG